MNAFFEHQKVHFKKSYLRNLITLAASDGMLDQTEKDLIIKIGSKRGLKPRQIDEILAEEIHQEFFVPESIDNKFALLYDVMLIVMNDFKVDERERTYIDYILGKLQLPKSFAKDLIDTFKKGEPSMSDWRELKELLRLDYVLTERDR